jgi:HEPN domain-containing protein
LFSDGIELNSSKKKDLSASDLKKLAKKRLGDAKALYQARRYEGAYYICGYAVELILKYRICVTLGWTEFTALRELGKAIKTHKFEDLLHFSGGVISCIRMGAGDSVFTG